MIPDAAWAVLAGLLGLAIGSFLNVVIYRVPAGESIVRPASRCPSCGAEIRNRHNVPVMGWLVLRGRCYDCKAPISARYPLVEAFTGLLFAAVTLRILHLDLGSALPAYLYFTAIGVALISAVGASASSTVRQGGTFNVDLSTDTDYTDPALAYLSSSWEMEYATGLKLMKRATRDIDKSPKLFRAFARDSLREIQWNAIGCSTPLIRKIMLGCRQPVDEWTRQRGNAKRVLIGFEVPK